LNARLSRSVTAVGTALDAGWSDQQLRELAAHVTLNLLTNYFDHFVQTDLDLSAGPPL